MPRVRRKRFHGEVENACETRPATAQQVWALVEMLRAQEFDYDRLCALMNSGALMELFLLSKTPERGVELGIARRLLLELRVDPDRWVDGCAKPRENKGYDVLFDLPQQLFYFDPDLLSFWEPSRISTKISDLSLETYKMKVANDAILAWFMRNLEKIPNDWKSYGNRRILFFGTRYKMGIYERVPALVWDNAEGTWSEDLLDVNNGLNERLWRYDVLLLQSQRGTDLARKLAEPKT
jgi:hypothetical protein